MFFPFPGAKLFFVCALLEYNCFIMLCQFLLYNIVNWPYAYIYPFPLEPPSHLAISPLQVITGASPVTQMVKHLPTMRETWVQSLGWEDPLEKEMATHSSIHAWKIPWAKDPGGLPSIGSAKSWTRLSDFTSLQVITEHQAELLGLCSSFPLTIYFAHGRVYMSMLLSQFFSFLPQVSLSSSPSICTSLFSHLCLYSCPGNGFMSTIFQIRYININI